ncbi:MAG: ATP-binding protein [Saprospiraceae bacterium]
MPFIPRQIAASISKLKEQYPILALTGPRQSGKTTLLRNMFPDYRYITLEDANLRSFAEDDPVGFLKIYDSRVIFDEAQRVPHLFSYLQAIVDASGQMGQYILSGSQNFHLLSNITQSLAGRVALFKLLPLDFRELKQNGLLPNLWQTLIFRGAYPAVYDRGIEPPVFYSNYLQTYLDRDVTELSKVQDMRAFRNFIGLCAARMGQLLNLSNLANACGITQPTAKAWLSILESSYIVFQLQPYFQNFSKRIVKTPKLYFHDTGLACFLLGIRREEELDNPTLLGSLFENLVVAEKLRQNHHQYQLRDFWFWRDSNGNEMDLLCENGLALDIFEIKSTQTVLSNSLKGLDFFSEMAGTKVQTKTLIYGGNESQHRTRYTVQSWQDV